MYEAVASPAAFKAKYHPVSECGPVECLLVVVHRPVRLGSRAVRPSVRPPSVRRRRRVQPCLTPPPHFRPRSFPPPSPPLRAAPSSHQLAKRGTYLSTKKPPLAAVNQRGEETVLSGMIDGLKAHADILETKGVCGQRRGAVPGGGRGRYQGLRGLPITHARMLFSRVAVWKTRGCHEEFVRVVLGDHVVRGTSERGFSLTTNVRRFSDKLSAAG